MKIDVSGLADNLHTLYFQVWDDDSCWSCPEARLFLKTPEPDSHLAYWFDTHREDGSTLSAGKGVIDVSRLSDGFHTLYVQGGGMSPSSVRSTLFLKRALAGEAVCTYWFDGRHEERDTLASTGATAIDVAHLADGFHTLHTQVIGSSFSSVQDGMFIKIPQTERIPYMTCQFFVDSVLYKKERVATEHGAMSWTIDTEGISPGLHKAQVLVTTPSGASTGLAETFFFRPYTEIASMKCLYSIDGGRHYVQAGNIGNGTFHFDIDVSSLSDGLHRLLYLMTDEKGMCSNILSAFFLKNPVGGNRIVRYDYWLNDNEARRNTETLTGESNPLHLLELLPVDPQPLRSSRFHFEVDEAKIPAVYAINDLHIRFFDAYGRTTEASESFIDYQKGYGVELRNLFAEAKGSVVTGKPGTDSLVWFGIRTAEGDSIALQTDRDCTLQLFSPTGEELYRASGAETTRYGGVRVAEAGVCYVCLHDVTGGEGDEIRLSYTKQVDPTGIGRVKNDVAGNDELVNVYNIAGKLVRGKVKKSEALKDLPSGVYIVKDKKYKVR